MDEYKPLFDELHEALNEYLSVRLEWAQALAKARLIEGDSIIDPDVERNLYRSAQMALEGASQEQVASGATQLPQDYLTAFDQLSIALENLKRYLANVSGEADSAAGH